ncbi:methylated-DNA--protein-cysteine methyltransferase [Microbacterium sorbitolivorans]|uniref:Methylated-DNA--protein-cysteine methyltransferase n=1 Tax=Microbacterium sorbitolivorans TaxID=1867410 RepID=A0A367Y6W7_9MICO|nr:methylated-DNA--[protein]-cysteine S-methyltransferase [Microbacterium sorbitolivorans]RCK61615.1 methylated-DNA--[protein]-cysteine S-methyltransferase [Microbacterium sorbitolivorans]GGF30661.1 methylated-DNA--protein-cysteine methyltransferase [Microbacterium sorbitolivorans]
MAHLLADSPLGTLTIASNGSAITGVWYEQHRYPPTAETLGERALPGTDPLLDAAATQLTEYLAGERASFDLPLDPAGTEKQKAVWDILCRIPAGQSRTYGEIARELGNPNAAQAVGQAVGHNPVSIVIPCHRVMGADGSVTGYAGGVERKSFLLELEGYRSADTLF